MVESTVTSEGEAEDTGSPHVADLLASVVVFLVALPLCIGIAVACGVPPERGLLTGIVGGLVVGPVAGSPLLVSGPAASLIVLVFALVETHGLAMLGPTVVLTGLWQLAAGALRAGTWFRAVAPAVIHGMMMGIGTLIVASQLLVLVDADPSGSFFENTGRVPGEFAAAVRAAWAGEPGALHALAIGIVTLVTLVAWNQWKPRRLSLVPGHLVAVLAAVAGAAALSLDIRFLKVSGGFLESLDPVGLPELRRLADPDLLLRSFVFAFVASAATLLTATAVDQMQSHTRTDYDREMLAQGLGNAVAGLLGGLPMTGVIVRSSTNVQAGARTRASTILHGAWLLIFVAMVPAALGLIPRACLGAVLVYVGGKLMDHEALRDLHRLGRGELAICLLTYGGVVCLDLFSGILLGLAASVVKLLASFDSLEVRVDRSRDRSRIDLFLAGPATFLTLPKLAETLDALPSDVRVHVHLDDLAYVDHACIELLSSFEQRLEAGGGSLALHWPELSRRYREGPFSMHGSRRPRAQGQRPPSRYLHLLREAADVAMGRTSRVHRRTPVPGTAYTRASALLDVPGQALHDLVEVAVAPLVDGAHIPPEEVAAALRERARDPGLYLGHGVAVPHATLPGIGPPRVLLVRSREEIEVDGEPADLFFFLLGPDDDPDLHLLTLARIARACQAPEVLASLRSERHPDRVRELLRKLLTTEAAAPARDDSERRVLVTVEASEDPRRKQLLADLLQGSFGRVAVLPAQAQREALADMRRLMIEVRGAPADGDLLVVAAPEERVDALEALLREFSRLAGIPTPRVRVLEPPPLQDAPGPRVHSLESQPP